MINSGFREPFFCDTIDFERCKGWRCILLIHEDISAFRVIDRYQLNLIKIGGFPQLLRNLNGILAGLRLYLRSRNFHKILCFIGRDEPH